MNATRLPQIGAAAVGAGVASYASYAAVTWARYGHVRSARRPRDELLDRFLPNPEVDEYHALTVRAPSAVTFAAGKQMDLQAALPIRAIFWARSLPALLHGAPFRTEGPRGIIEETLALGFGVLAEVPDRQIVIGTYTQPWHEDVTFHPLPAEEFREFSEPGYVKIAVSFAAEPLGDDRSRFVTRTRVLATDPEARRKFRLYWAPMSAGIILIRYLCLPMVRRDAEQRVRTAGNGTALHGADTIPAGHAR